MSQGIVAFDLSGTVADRPPTLQRVPGDFQEYAVPGMVQLFSALRRQDYRPVVISHGRGDRARTALDQLGVRERDAFLRSIKKAGVLEALSKDDAVRVYVGDCGADIEGPAEVVPTIVFRWNVPVRAKDMRRVRSELEAEAKPTDSRVALGVPELVTTLDELGVSLGQHTPKLSVSDLFTLGTPLQS